MGRSGLQRGYRKKPRVLDRPTQVPILSNRLRKNGIVTSRFRLVVVEPKRTGITIHDGRKKGITPALIKGTNVFTVRSRETFCFMFQRSSLRLYDGNKSRLMSGSLIHAVLH